MVSENKGMFVMIPVSSLLSKRVLDKNTNQYREARDIMEEKFIKEDYVTTFPTDELGKNINEDISYYNLFMGMLNGDDVYDMLGVSDTIIRERIFRLLSEMMEVGYDVIYYAWLNS